MLRRLKAAFKRARERWYAYWVNRAWRKWIREAPRRRDPVYLMNELSDADVRRLVELLCGLADPEVERSLRAWTPDEEEGETLVQVGSKAKSRAQ